MCLSYSKHYLLYYFASLVNNRSDEMIGSHRTVKNNPTSCITINVKVQ